MKYRLLDLLQAVDDGSQLQLAEATEVRTVPLTAQLNGVQCSRYCGLKGCVVEEADVTPQDCSSCYTKEIVEGELVAESGERYPITGGIPRLLSTSTAEFLRKNKESFSLEWKYFRFGERNWGMDIESRKELFLTALGKSPEELRGKLIFDAGCGSGLLAKEMGDSFGMEVVGLDLSTGIEQAYRVNTNPFVHYVQGSVLEPPLKNHVADYIYCAGVLVTIPDTWAGLRALSRCARQAGTCFVWLYHPLDRHRATGDYVNEVTYEWLRRHMTSRMPIRLQELFYLALLLPYYVKRAVLTPFRHRKEDRTWREKMQNFIDTMSPVYANRHNEEETIARFREVGLNDAIVAYNDLYGFGIRGRMRASSDVSST